MHADQLSNEDVTRDVVVFHVGVITSVTRLFTGVCVVFSMGGHYARSRHAKSKESHRKVSLLNRHKYAELLH